MRESVTHYGLGSRGALHVMAALSPLFGRPLSPTLVWERPRPDALASSFEDDSAAPSPGRQPIEENAYEALIADLAESERGRA